MQMQEQIQKQVLHYMKASGEKTVMENETHASNGFEIENCRARIRGTVGLVDCLSPKQAMFCGSSSPFGNGYLCHHLSRNKILENTNLENTKKNELSPPSDIAQSDNMENESRTGKSFKVENCRAENIIKDWVDCLSTEQACICGFSVACNTGYSCEHPSRFGIVQITKELRSNSIFPPNILQSDSQE